MSVRWIATAALTFGVAGLLALTAEGAWPFASLELRHRREMKSRVAVPADPTPTRFEALDALPTRSSVAEYSAIERRAVAVEGFVERFDARGNGEVALRIVREWPTTRGTTGALLATLSPSFRARHPEWAVDALVAELRLTERAELPAGGEARRVRVSGWLMFDAAWSIHPVTRLEVWDASLARYRDAGVYPEVTTKRGGGA
ncbi:MAG: hypothetical protein HOP12_09185 [Candidatus Eisenbacteria bacterium]|uniref:Uncharacterized protein n=1 Tax=Eiseniibacteriota bacterium TaxID=2212470 RepID=A0A849SF17_UNCEI|nr:hypothetical protein [Candidatus Eisenbacteria bacterium]